MVPSACSFSFFGLKEDEETESEEGRDDADIGEYNAFVLDSADIRWLSEWW